VFWLLGPVQPTSWIKVATNAGVLPVGLPRFRHRAWMLTAIGSFGDQAAVLGIRIGRGRFLMLLAAAVTATVGVVGFVGRVDPHIARLLVGEDQRFTCAPRQPTAC
jgi:iron complex transport system permease protein